ncbi:pilus assembly protein [Vibrio mimicus]
MMRKHQKGSLTVEVAIGLPILMMAIFTWIELCVFTYSLTVTDHALTTGVMRVKKLGDASNSKTIDYDRMLQEQLKRSGGALWNNVVKPESVTAKIRYFRNYDDLLNCSYSGSENVEECPTAEEQPKNMAIAVYELRYEYQPMFNYLLPKMQIRREVLSVQEYERCTFKVGQGAGCAS